MALIRCIIGNQRAEPGNQLVLEYGDALRCRELSIMLTCEHEHFHSTVGVSVFLPANDSRQHEQAAILSQEGLQHEPSVFRRSSAQ